jgi:uncharacterized OsmC-like protein
MKIDRCGIMIRSSAQWMNGYLTKVNNGRGHTVNMDLPSSQNGEDTAATAVEYMVMGYAGCTVTIFKIIADRMRLNIDSVEIDVEAEKPKSQGRWKQLLKWYPYFRSLLLNLKKKLTKLWR